MVESYKVRQGRTEGGAPGALAPGAKVRGRKSGDLKRDLCH